MFLNQCGQQGFKPKIITAGKVDEFPQGVYPYGDRAINFADRGLVVEIPSLFVRPDRTIVEELADEYEKAATNRLRWAWAFAIRFWRSPIAALKLSQKLDDPASIRDALRETHSNHRRPGRFQEGPLPNTSLTKLAFGQWRKGKKWPLELVIVDNTAGARTFR